MNYTKSLGNLVKAARLKSGLTQAELAHEMGLGLRTVADIENYEANPRFDTLCRVISYLNLPVDSIFYSEVQSEKENILRKIIHQELSHFSENDLNVALEVLEGLRKGLHPQNPK